jgi:hypothetical protein
MKNHEHLSEKGIGQVMHLENCMSGIAMLDLFASRVTTERQTGRLKTA